jgi:chromosome segregation ATPase
VSAPVQVPVLDPQLLARQDELVARQDDVVARQDEVAARQRELASSVADLHGQLDVLREQLETAFGDVDRQFDAVGRHLGATATESRERHDTTQTLLAAVHEMQAALRDLSSTAGAPGPHLAALAEALERVVVASSSDVIKRVDALPQPASSTQLTGVVQSLEQKLAASVEGVAGQVERLGAQTQEELAVLQQAMRALARMPTPVDIAPFEAALEGTALRVSADVANVRGDVTQLGRIVEAQQHELRELRATLDWIKERLLLR